MYINEAKWDGVSYPFNPKEALQDMLDTLGDNADYHDFTRFIICEISSEMNNESDSPPATEFYEYLKREICDFVASRLKKYFQRIYFKGEYFESGYMGRMHEIEGVFDEFVNNAPSRKKHYYDMIAKRAKELDCE